MFKLKVFTTILILMIFLSGASPGQAALPDCATTEDPGVWVEGIMVYNEVVLVTFGTDHPGTTYVGGLVLYWTLENKDTQAVRFMYWQLSGSPNKLKIFDGYDWGSPTSPILKTPLPMVQGNYYHWETWFLYDLYATTLRARVLLPTCYLEFWIQQP